MPAKKIHLLVIDPQNSFCKVVPPAEQQIVHDGELCVPGAWDDMAVRLPKMISRLGKKLADLHMTLDCHHTQHVAHPVWYFNVNNGSHPAPFTVMREENDTIIGSQMDSNGQSHDVGEFRCFNPSTTKRTIEYLKALKAANRYPHVVWPMHCLIGTPGNNVVAPLMEAALAWTELVGGSAINFVTKGSNPFVEHFSAVKAEVPDPQDPGTQLNVDFIDTVQTADEVLLAGEASSHCLANTVRDIADSFQDDSFIKKCVLLTDATSPVPTFESYTDKFISDMTSRGMKTTTTVDYLA